MFMFSSINIYLYEHISAHNIPQMSQQGGANDYSCFSHAQSRAGRGLRRGQHMVVTLEACEVEYVFR